MNIIFKSWREHGTKMIGLVSVTFGAIATMDPQVIEDIFGPKGRSWAIMIAGVLMVWRGFKNTDARDRKDTDANAERTT